MDHVNISNEIGIFNDHNIIIAVDTQRMIRFIHKYGVNCIDTSIGHNIVARLEDFIDVMTIEQMRIFFSYKPNMVHKDQNETYPLMPITFRNYPQTIDIVNTILECCDTHPQFEMWKKLFKVEITNHFEMSKKFNTLKHIFMLFDNHEKRSTRFFDLMRVKLIK